MTQTADVIAFDLDLTLASPKTMGSRLFEPMRSSLNEWGVSPARQDEMIETELWNGAPEEAIGALTDLTAEQQVSLLSQYDQLPIPDGYQAYGDTMPFLSVIHKLPKDSRPTLVLVTRGLVGFQRSKFLRLGIKPFFDKILVVGEDSECHFGDKESAFSEMQTMTDHWIVVGDNANDELQAGRNLDMVTVQTLRQGVLKDSKAGHHINVLDALWPIIGYEKPSIAA